MFVFVKGKEWKKNCVEGFFSHSLFLSLTLLPPSPPFFSSKKQAMFALKARPASLAPRRGHTSTRRSSQIVRVAEFERKTADKLPKISVPAVDGGETPLSILNDGADAFAELVALNKPKQSVNRPQKVREGDGSVREKGADGSAEGETESAMARGMPKTTRATLTLSFSQLFYSQTPPPTGGRLPPEPDFRRLLPVLDQGVQGGGP